MVLRNLTYLKEVLMTYKETIKDKELRDIILSTVNDMAETIGYTYGPNGSTVILTDDMGKPYATKDGVSVAKEIYYKDPVKNMIAKIIKQAAIETLNEAGDGTTTATILINYIITKGMELLEDGVPFLKIKEELENLEAHTIGELKKNKRDIRDNNELYHIGLISSNNDKGIARLVKEAFIHSNHVKVEKGNSVNDSLERISGMNLKTTYHDSAFINNNDLKIIEYEKSKVMIIDGKYTDFDKLKTILTTKEPLIIVAEDFSEHVMQLLKHNHNRGSIRVGLVKSPGIGEHRKNLLEDLAIYTGGQVINPNRLQLDSKVLGEVDGVTVTKETCTFYSENERDEVAERIKSIRRYIESDIQEYDKELAEQRIEHLEGTSAIIRVGGDSDVAIAERYDRVDDAVRAVGCAKEEGIVEGGGLALAKSIGKLENLFLGLLFEPFKRITGKELDEDDLKVDMFEKNIVDPFKVTRVALQNAISIAKVILSTKAIIINKDEWKF